MSEESFHSLDKSRFQKRLKEAEAAFAVILSFWEDNWMDRAAFPILSKIHFLSIKAIDALLTDQPPCSASFRRKDTE